MKIAAPNVVWTPLPAGFVHESLAVVDRTILLGEGSLRGLGAGRASCRARAEDRPGTRAGGAVLEAPAPLPGRSNVESVPFEESGPALVSTSKVGSAVVSTVMIRFSSDFPGCLGGWYHPLGTEIWEYIGSASTETDIDANDQIGIADGVLVTSESESSELFVVERRGVVGDVTWPSGVVTRSCWRPRHIELPEDVTTSGASVASSGRWIALRGEQSSRMRDGVLVYERGPTGWALALQLDYPGFRVASVEVTDRWLVVLESNRGAARLRWRQAITGEDRYLELDDYDTSLDVLGDRALVTQGHRALVVDLVEGSSPTISSVVGCPSWAMAGSRRTLRCSPSPTRWESRCYDPVMIHPGSPPGRQPVDDGVLPGPRRPPLRGGMEPAMSRPGLRSSKALQQADMPG